jgi:phosphatidylglycerophosphate synthase
MVTSVRLLAAKDGNVIAASNAGKLKTVMQFVAIIYMIAALEVCSWQNTLLSGMLPDAFYTVLMIVGRVLVWVSVLFTVISGVEYVWNGRKYFLDA